VAVFSAYHALATGSFRGKGHVGRCGRPLLQQPAAAEQQVASKGGGAQTSQGKKPQNAAPKLY